MTDSRAAAGVCSGVVEQSCIDEILQRASDIADEANDYACEKLEQEMKQDFDGCTSFGGRGNSLGNFTIQSLDNLVEIANNSYVLRKLTSQMTCLKVITEQQVSNPDRSGNIAIALKGNWLFTSIFVFMGIFTVL
ncbi:hypothetical protein MaudCBS49596_006930 [Microsporum audouinii]